MHTFTSSYQSDSLAQQQGDHNYSQLVHNAYMHFKLQSDSLAQYWQETVTWESPWPVSSTNNPDVKLQSEPYLSLPPEQLNKFLVALEQMHRVIVIQELQWNLSFILMICTQQQIHSANCLSANSSNALSMFPHHSAKLLFHLTL
jgi:hypothetical protein